MFTNYRKLNAVPGSVWSLAMPGFSWPFSVFSPAIIGNTSARLSEVNFRFSVSLSLFHRFVRSATRSIGLTLVISG
jgi:hypothetical protein